MALARYSSFPCISPRHLLAPKASYVMAPGLEDLT